MTYEPRPLDTRGVELGPDIRALTERLAAHAHDVWAARRLAEGWTHGPRRDDEKKQTPCLVPYEELSESEKEYDRAAALETIKAILVLGYTITKA